MKRKFWKRCLIRLGTSYAVLEGKVKLKIYKNLCERPRTGMKGSGSWSMESLHGGKLLGAGGNGFVMFWDWESGEIVRRIDVDLILPSLFSLIQPFLSRFLVWYWFVGGHHS